MDLEARRAAAAASGMPITQDMTTADLDRGGTKTELLWPIIPPDADALAAATPAAAVAGTIEAAAAKEQHEQHQQHQQQEREEVPREFTCAVCLDILTHPVALRGCGHAFCRLCAYRCIEASLLQQYRGANAGRRRTTALTAAAPPTCPLCRCEIARISDVVRDPALGKAIARRFPTEVRAKVASTHSLARQREAAGRLSWMAKAIYEGRVVDGDGEGVDSGERASSSTSSSSSWEDEDEEDEQEAQQERQELVMLTVEFVMLSYAVLLYLGWAWCKMDRFIPL